MMTTLTELVMAYKEHGRGEEELLQRLSTMTYAFPTQYRGFDEDDAGEFLLFLYPKFLRLVRNFSPQGKPFEHYFKRCLRWQVRTFATEMRTRRARYRAEECPGLWPDACVYGEAEVRERENIYGADFFAKTEEEPSMADPEVRRMVVLALKVCTSVDDGQLHRLAKEIGVSTSWLVSQRDVLEERLRQKDPRLMTLRYRRNSAYATIVHVEGELTRCVDPRRRAHLEYRLAVHRKRFEMACSLLARVPRRPTNQEIAVLLGIPKGSVDSILFYLRKRAGFRHTRRHVGTSARNEQSAQEARV